MKTDLDSLMQAHNYDAMLITGDAFHNPPMVYMTGGAVHVSHAELIKLRGAPPVLFFNSMERDEAAKTGLATRSLDDYRISDLLKETNGDRLQAEALRYKRILTDIGLTRGRVVVYGQVDAGKAFSVFSALQQMLPEISLTGDLDGALLMKATATKDANEIEHIRHMGQITTEVVSRVADFITGHAVRDEVVVQKDGTPLTIGVVKQKINLWLAELGAENPEGVIFAQGSDAGVPHSSGKDDEALHLGRTIVFDIFPCEAGGGYFYDFTRTWSLGYATDEAQQLYDQVKSVYNQVGSEMRAGELCKLYQDRTCELFEAMGHPTIRSHPGTQEGYVHSLGHGLGLNVHERPMFSAMGTEDDRLFPGTVVTSEPGLYYPERGLGVRLEDTLWVRPDGGIEVLAPYPMELVLPMKK